jgi:hypothetical protein
MSKRAEAKPKKELPATYAAWAIERAMLRFSKAEARYGMPMKCSTRRLICVPKYLCGLETSEQRRAWGERQLRVTRNAGVLVCTDGYWWVRGVDYTPPAPTKKEIDRQRHTVAARRMPDPKPPVKNKSKAKLRLVKS